MVHAFVSIVLVAYLQLFLV